MATAKGLFIPDFIYGTAWKEDRTAALTELALRMGFRGIDTACQPKHYDEAGVGAGVKACLNARLVRRDLYLQTKFTTPSEIQTMLIPRALAGVDILGQARTGTSQCSGAVAAHRQLEGGGATVE